MGQGQSWHTVVSRTRLRQHFLPLLLAPREPWKRREADSARPRACDDLCGLRGVGLAVDS